MMSAAPKANEAMTGNAMMSGGAMMSASQSSGAPMVEGNMPELARRHGLAEFEAADA